MTRLRRRRVIADRRARRGCERRRSSRAWDIRRTTFLPPAIGPPISTPGAAWAWRRRSASASRSRGRTSASFVLDGDGSLLMNLGSLATIGCSQPANLVAHRDGQRAVRDDRRPGHADGARRRPRSGRARDGHRQSVTVRTGRRARARSIARRPRRARGDRGQGRRVAADGEAAARLRRSSSSASWPRSVEPDAGRVRTLVRAISRSLGEFVAARCRRPTRARGGARRPRHGRRRRWPARSEPAARIVQQVVAADGQRRRASCSARALARPRRRRRAGQRHRRARARLRRHVLRLARASKRAARRRRRSRRRRSPAPRAARSSTPTSSASRSKRGSGAR